MTDTTEAPFTLRDGLNIALYDWPLPRRLRPRGVVLIVHGLGEHAWRYDAVARVLNEWGFCVRAYDQRGHGESGGDRGTIPYDDALLDDLAEIIDDTRHHISAPWACPLILLGHSMGGLVASLAVARGLASVDALVLSSPALMVKTSAIQRGLISLLQRWSPNLAVSNGLDATKISHNPDVVKAYQTDRLVHDRISARLAQFIAANGQAVLTQAPRWHVPTLLMYAGDDQLVMPEGSRAFALKANTQYVTSHCLEGQFHEIFNETDPSETYRVLRQWLESIAPT